MLEIRSAGPGDDAALSAIDVATWSPQVTPAPRPERPTPFFSERVEPADVLVAASDGTAVGYVVLRQWSHLPSHRHVVEINGLAVDPGHQRRGIGRLLVEEATQEAARRGVAKVSLRVLAPNAPARRLYEACGFVVEGILRGEFVLEERPVDDVLMACHLDPPEPRT